jgi:hypothetical protein
MLIDGTIYAVTVQRDTVEFELADGRRVIAPRENSPLLHLAGQSRCGDAVIADDGLSVCWPAIGETVSVAHVLTRRRLGNAA